MIRQTLEHISGISIYPLISFVIFFAFFTVLIWYVFSLRKKHVEELSQLPLEDYSETNRKGGYPHA
jgi:cytochrome c oxidase cbb3-type subunit 4